MSVASLSQELGVSNIFTSKKRNTLVHEARILLMAKRGNLTVISYDIKLAKLQIHLSQQYNNLVKNVANYNELEEFKEKYEVIFRETSYLSAWGVDEDLRKKYVSVRKDVNHLIDFLDQIEQENIGNNGK